MASGAAAPRPYTLTMADRLLSYRPRFPILQTCSYLVSHSLGAMPDTAADQLQRFATEWAGRGVQAWPEGWWDAPLTVGDVLAPILGAPAGSVAMVPNVTFAQAVIASSLTFTPRRNRVVFSELNFPSVGYVWHNVAGAEVRIVRSWDGMTIPTETFLAAIDERTAVVPLSHVLFKSGYVQDVTAITRRAHEMGAVVVLDCYQSAGTLPFSLTELDVDLAVGGSVKWLCGGPGAGWLYVRPDLQEELQPRLVGWQADREPFAFRPGPIEYRTGVGRFLSGTPGVPALFAARAGYEIVAEIGVESIRERSLHLTDRIIEAADGFDIPVRSERRHDQRGGTVVLGVADEDKVAAELIERGVIVDSRPEAGLRIGPHFYTSDDDLERLFEALAAILGR